MSKQTLIRFYVSNNLARIMILWVMGLPLRRSTGGEFTVLKCPFPGWNIIKTDVSLFLGNLHLQSLYCLKKDYIKRNIALISACDICKMFQWSITDVPPTVPPTIYREIPLWKISKEKPHSINKVGMYKMCLYVLSRNHVLIWSHRVVYLVQNV